ncbi:hypothetical protein [Wolbachia endosymbiont (group A) of Cheilosia soror]|uniref:hypothetical protein n=1 Tax=Wolbachia endosymbiont (group A) of Cheilosia soror TaxID=2953995 RepID=UPI0021F8E9E1|nr:hypothetical protein [Wolbachia endosymbiont (group A) of Cheilosia soror]
MRILKETNKANITYELAGEEGRLTGKDEERLFKLLKKIGKGKSISKEFSKSDYNTRKFLLVIVTDTHGGRIERFTLLHYAKFCKNERATRDILEEAKKHDLSEEVNNEKIVSHYLGSHGKLIHTYSAVEDGVVRVKDLKDWSNKKVINPNVTTATLDIPSDITSLKSDEEGKNSLIETIMEGSVTCNVSKDIEEVSDKENFYVEQQKEITDTIETSIWPCKKINNGEDISIYQSMYEKNRETQGNFTNSGKTLVKELNAFRILSSNPCVNDKSCKVADRESSTKTMQQRAILAGVVGVVLLVSGVVFHIMEMPTIGVVGMIAGLACISFALYSTLEPSTKLENVEQSFQSNAKEYY